jgi:hypothetical protein
LNEFVDLSSSIITRAHVEYIQKDPSESILLEVAMGEKVRYGALATLTPLFLQPLRSRLLRVSFVHLHPAVQLRLGSITELCLHGNGNGTLKLMGQQNNQNNHPCFHLRPTNEFMI